MRSLVWIGAFCGSALGELVPQLWGGDAFSFANVGFGLVGGVLGIWIGHRLST